MRGRILGGLAVLAAVLVGGLSCKGPPPRPLVEPPPQDVEPTTLDYTDADAFDLVFEAALVRQDPAILVRTPHTQPDWGPRLNAWIAAWNRGGKVAAGPRAVRGQSPVTIDGETLRQFRLLVEGLMDRVEDIASRQSVWWAEEKTRARRVELLRPYNLRFHMDEDGRIQLVFYNGRYAESYAGFVRSMTRLEEKEEWSRTMRCSACRGREATGSAGE